MKKLLKKLLKKIYPYHHTLQLGPLMIDWTSSRHPTSFIETVNFDFTKYESEDE